MIVYRAIIWAEDRAEWPKNDHQNNIGVYVSNDQRALAAGSVEHLLIRVQKAADSIPTNRDAMRLAYSFTTDRADRAQPVTKQS